MRRIPSPYRHRSSHRGLTLIEVLIALALSSVLLSAVYVALDLHWQYSSAGRDEAERSQLARAIASRLEVDLRSVVYRQKPTEGAAEEAPPSEDAAEAGADGASGEEESIEFTIDPADSDATSGTGLFGNSSTLMVHISQPSRTLQYTPLGLSQAGDRTSDLQTVSWFVATQDAGGLQGEVAQQGEGLTRTSGDRLTTQLADEEGDLQSLAANALVLAPEVASIQFQYYDGAGWRADWNSDTLGGLPRAIEILMEIRSSGAHRKMDSSPRLYRLVVALPIARPLPY